MADSKIGENQNNSDKKGQSEADEENSSGSSVSASEGEDNESTLQIGKGVGQAAVTVNRDDYLQAYRDLIFDRNQLQLKNNILHRRLAEYYKKRKLEHVLKQLEGSSDLEEKYQQKLMVYEELKEKEEREVADIKAKVQAVEQQYADRLEYAEKKFDGLQAFEQSTGTGLIYSSKGKPIAEKMAYTAIPSVGVLVLPSWEHSEELALKKASLTRFDLGLTVALEKTLMLSLGKTVQRFLTLQRRKCEQSSALCLRYIRARNAVAELDAIVRKLEMLGPGLYVAQYEQLHIDHQNFMTKIEERDDELIRNRSKCTEYNQILAHIREKMHHTDEVIDYTECDLGDAEMEFLRAREDLGQVKSQRDRLRWSLEDEKLKAGLLTRKDLLRDFQDATDNVVQLREIKEKLETQIEKTTRKLREARKRMQGEKTVAQESASD